MTLLSTGHCVSSSPGQQNGDASAAWPVGAVFISVVSTNPATLLGFGTWSAFGAGRVLVGLDSGNPAFDTAEETGGSLTATPAGTVSQPTFTGNALGTHAHAPGTLATSAHSGAAVTDHASHTHSYTDIVNHTHPVTDPGHNHTQTAHTHVQNSHQHTEALQGGTTGTTTGTHLMGSAATGGSLRNAGQSTVAATAVNQNATAVNQSATTGVTTANPAGGVASGTTGGPSATLTHSVTQPAAHSLSGSTEAVSAGTPSGTVSQPTFAGDALSVVQPYIVVYFWKRTA